MIRSTPSVPRGVSKPRPESLRTRLFKNLSGALARTNPPGGRNLATGRKSFGWGRSSGVAKGLDDGEDAIDLIDAILGFAPEAGGEAFEEVSRAGVGVLADGGQPHPPRPSSAGKDAGACPRRVRCHPASEGIDAHGKLPLPNALPLGFPSAVLTSRHPRLSARSLWQEDRRWRRVTTNGLPSAAQRLNTPP